MLAYDDQLSALLGQTDNPASATLATQRFVAESVALLDERPGTSSRSVLVAAPRSFNPDPAAASAFFQTAASIPWLEPVTTATLLSDAARAVPMPKEVGTRPSPKPSESPAPQDPYAASRPVLNARRLAFLENGLRTVHGWRRSARTGGLPAHVGPGDGAAGLDALAHLALVMVQARPADHRRDP